MASPDQRQRFGFLPPPHQEENLASVRELGEKGIRISRPYLFTTLLQSGGPLTETHVRALGEVLYQDTLADTPRSLADSYQAAGLLTDRNAEDIRGNFVLNHTALRYEKNEMEQARPGILEPDDLIPSVIENRAGSGPGRPLLLELYLLRGLGLVDDRIVESEDVQFNLTDTGNRFAKAIAVRFNYAEWSGQNPLLVIGRSSQEVRSR